MSDYGTLVETDDSGGNEKKRKERDEKAAIHRRRQRINTMCISALPLRHARYFCANKDVKQDCSLLFSSYARAT